MSHTSLTQSPGQGCQQSWTVYETKGAPRFGFQPLTRAYPRRFPEGRYQKAWKLPPRPATGTPKQSKAKSWYIDGTF